MEELPLPAELERLERLLTGGPRPQPSPALRHRVLGRVRSELRGERDLPSWRAAAAFAASLLVGLSLWLGALQASTVAMQQSQEPPSIEEIARQLRQVAPTLSEGQSLRQAMLRQIGASASGELPLGDIPFFTCAHELDHP